MWYGAYCDYMSVKSQLISLVRLITTCPHSYICKYDHTLPYLAVITLSFYIQLESITLEALVMFGKQYLHICNLLLPLCKFCLIMKVNWANHQATADLLVVM